MSDELRCLPGEQEFARRLVAPTPHRLERRRAIKRAIDFGRGKLPGVPGKPVLLRHVTRVEGAAPTIVGPAGGADCDGAHGSTLCAALARTQMRMLNNAAGRRWLSRSPCVSLAPEKSADVAQTSRPHRFSPDRGEGRLLPSGGQGRRAFAFRLAVLAR